MVFNFPSNGRIGYTHYFSMIFVAIMANALIGCTASSYHEKTVTQNFEEASMTQQCFTNYVKHPHEMEFYEETLSLTRSELSAQWQRPIPDGLMLIGGIDMFGLARFCQFTDTNPHLFEGEYVDPRMWIKGTFRYHHPEGLPISEDIFNEYYMSDYTGQKLVLYSRPDHKKRIHLVPVDIINLPIPGQDPE